MSIGLIGRKRGMTRVYTPEGEAIPVTVIEIETRGNTVTQVKKENTADGYAALQVSAGVGQTKPSRLTKPLRGHYAKAGVAPGRVLCEFRVSQAQVEEYHVGDIVRPDIFSVGQKVSVSGVTKGKGFAGAVKRHHFRTQDMSHGNSRSHRAPGSIGQRQTPGRVFKNKRMAGHLGNVNRTAQNLEVVRVDLERGLLLVKGAVPGYAGCDLYITATGNQ
jgi:large subunit ribosomal protein L3